MIDDERWWKRWWREFAYDLSTNLSVLVFLGLFVLWLTLALLGAGNG